MSNNEGHASNQATPGEPVCPETRSLIELMVVHRILQEKFAGKKKKANRLIVMLVFVVTFFIIGLLAIIKIDTVKIECHFSASALSFQTETDLDFPNTTRLSIFSISPISTYEINFDRYVRRDSSIVEYSVPPGDDTTRASAINMNKILLKAGTQVDLMMEREGSLNMRLDPSPGEISVNTRGNIKISDDYGLSDIAEILSLSPPDNNPDIRAVSNFKIGPTDDFEKLGLWLKPVEKTPVSFPDEINVTKISFQETTHKPDKPGSNQRGALVVFSSLAAGKLYIEPFFNSDIQLRANHSLQFVTPIGKIKRLEISENQFKGILEAELDDIILGSGNFSKSLTPSWLEWLSSMEQVSFFWGIFLYIAGIIVAVYKFWKE